MKRIAVVVVVIVLITGIALFLGQSKIVLAEVNGEVFVNGEPAEVGMVLKEADKIVTREGSSAEVSLYEGSVLRIGESSELDLSTVKSNEIGINQLSGRTWSRIVKLSGIKNYFVKTPDAVATVRGTAFDVKLVEGETYVSSADGVVEVDNGAEKMNVEKDVAVMVSKKRLMRAQVKVDSWRTGNVDRDREHLKKIKHKLREKYSGLIERAKENYDLSEGEVENALDDYIEGRLDIRDLARMEREERIEKRFGKDLEETDVEEKNVEDVNVVEDIVERIEEPILDDEEPSRIDEEIIIGEEIKPEEVSEEIPRDAVEEPRKEVIDAVQ